MFRNFLCTVTPGTHDKVVGLLDARIVRVGVGPVEGALAEPVGSGRIVLRVRRALVGGGAVVAVRKSGDGNLSSDRIFLETDRSI